MDRPIKGKLVMLGASGVGATLLQDRVLINLS